MNIHLKHYFEPFSLFLIALVALLPGIQSDYLLLQGDEVMHIRTIRESLDAKAFLHPVIGGYSNPYKPPLLFWLGMFSDSIFGKSFFSERFPSVLMGASSVLLVFFILKSMKVSNKQNWIVCIFYLFSLGLYKFAKLAMMEVYLLFFLLLSVYFYIQYLKKNSLLWLILSAFVCGIGVLLKGPILVAYLVLILASFWVMSRFRIRSGKTLFLPSGSKFHFIRGAKWYELVFIWGPISLLPLAIWFLAIIFYTESGLAFIQFFIGSENIGKFGSDNQPEIRLLIGIIGYTAPWTVLFLMGFWKIFIQKEKNRKQFIAKWLVVSSILILLLHLLPNRKDAYYALPSLTLGFVAIGIGLNLQSIRNILLTKWNLIFQLLFLICLITLGIFFQSKYLILVFLPLVLFLFGIIGILFFHQENRVFINSYILSQLVAILFLQLFLLPSVPDKIPNLSETNFSEVCVVSKNPWDAWQIENAFPKIKVYYSPNIKTDCDKNNLPILALTEDIHSYTPDGYKLTKIWNLWSGKITEIGSGIPHYKDPKFYTKAYLLIKNQKKEN